MATDEEPAGYSDPTDYRGTEMLVTWGAEIYFPVKFNGFHVGPFSMTVVVQDGERPIDAKRRAMAHLNEIANEEIKERLPKFMEQCRRMKAAV